LPPYPESEETQTDSQSSLATSAPTESPTTTPTGQLEKPRIFSENNLYEETQSVPGGLLPPYPESEEIQTDSPSSVPTSASTESPTTTQTGQMEKPKIFSENNRYEETQSVPGGLLPPYPESEETQTDSPSSVPTSASTESPTTTQTDQ